MESRIDKFAKGFFWFGYAVFLSASIPHIAAYFRHFDPNTQDVWQNGFYWTIAVLLAVVIDVSDVLVSIAVMRAQANGAKFKDTYGFWLFIVLIMALSWLFNWQYNVVFQSADFRTVDAYQIAGSNLTVGQINPVLGSAFQLLLLVYTGMAHKFSQKPIEKTLQELIAEANEAEQRAQYLARIDLVKRAESSRKWQARFEEIRQVKDEAIKTIKGQDEEVSEDTKVPDEISPEANVVEAINPPASDETPVVEEPLPEVNDPVQTDVLNGSQTAFNDEIMPVLEAYPLIETEWLAKNKKSVTIEEIITVTGHSKRRLNRVAFARSSRNKELILVSSIIDWLKTAPKPEPKAINTDEMESVSPKNGHRKNTRPLPDLVEMEV